MQQKEDISLSKPQTVQRVIHRVVYHRNVFSPAKRLLKGDYHLLVYILNDSQGQRGDSGKITRAS